MGAIAAVNVGYLNNIEEIPSFLMDEYDSLGGLEGNSGNEGYDSSFHGIVNLCGAVGDASWIEEGDIPIVSMHGDQDDVIPYDENLVTLFGLDIQVDGSYIIHETMLDLGNYSGLHTYVNQGHTPFSSMVFETEFTSDFLYEIVCADETDYLNGDINFDYEINILDVVNLVNFILDVVEPSNIEFRNIHIYGGRAVETIHGQANPWYNPEADIFSDDLMGDFIYDENLDSLLFDTYIYEVSYY